LVLEVATKKNLDIRHFGFESRWNEKKTMMTNSALIVVLLDATTQEKKPG